MTIYLVQHGKSLPKEEDPNRSLSHEGIQEVEQIAAQLKAHNIQLKVIYHTSKKRAIQTADLFQAHLKSAKGTEEIEGMNPKDDVRLFSEDIAKSDKAMYVGHLPFMEKLVSYLVANDEETRIVKFQNGGIIKLDYDDEENHWLISGALLPQPV